MKTTIALVMLAGLGLSSVEVYADSQASMEFTIQGTAEKVCIMPEPNVMTSDNVSVTGQNITIDTLINEGDATLNTASVQLKFPEVMCNYPAKVSIKSMRGGLIRLDPGAAQMQAGSEEFKDRVDYRVSGSWGSLQLPQFTTEGVSEQYSQSVEAGGANKADMIVNLTVDGQDIPVLTGNYTDNIVVEVGLQP